MTWASRSAAFFLVAVAAAMPAPFSRLERAANGNDYAEFKAALTAARAEAAGLPPGGERDAANDALAVYADVETLWDYANNSTTGAFFDASTDGGALLSMLNRYPGFGHAIADATMESGGTTIYPTREARAFLAAEGARKLASIGAAPPPQQMAPVPNPPERRHALHPAPTANVGRLLNPSKSTPKSKPTLAKPSPAAAEDGLRTRPTSPPPMPQAPPEKPEAAGGRINLLLALIVIVVGLGVLIFLFRASD